MEDDKKQNTDPNPNPSAEAENGVASDKEKTESVPSQPNGTETNTVSDQAPASPAIAEEVTKRSIRVETWKKFQEHRCAAFPINIFNRIPNFIGAEKAAALLAETPEFKNAKHIKVNIEKSQDPVKLKAIAAGKVLYVPAAKESSALFAKINCPADADAVLQKKVIRSQSLKEYVTEIFINTDVKLDMLVIGSVTVAKDGYRIGKGNGYVDLDFGILAHCGVVTKNTLIVTTVHDVQVYNSLPVALFKNYDVPVDMIVTPTEVIRVSNKLARPTTIQWHLLSERRLGIVPILKVIKEKEEKEGKVIQLKSEDTDVESNRKQQKPRQNRRVVRRRRKPRTNTENGGDNNQENITPRPRRKRQRRFRKSKGDGEQSSNDKENSSSTRKRRDIRDFCIKVSNIAKHIRIKDLKAELRKRGCNPIFISWKGAYGKCYLHFGKHGAGDPEAAINQMLTSLNNLTLTVQRGETTQEVPLRVELIKRSPETNRMEAANITAV